MGEPINTGYLVVFGIILLVVFLVLLWEQITGVKFVRLSALAFAGAVKLYSPLVGNAMAGIFKTVIWF